MSSSFDKKKIITRYRIIAYAAVLLGMLIVGRVVYIGTVKHDYWMKVAAQKKVKTDQSFRKEEISSAVTVDCCRETCRSMK